MKTDRHKKTRDPRLELETRENLVGVTLSTADMKKNEI